MLLRTAQAGNQGVRIHTNSLVRRDYSAFPDSFFNAYF
jgi:hypothetical protein